MRGANAGWKWRVRVAALAGALLWPGWVGAYLLGDGECDFGGTIYAVDHLAFYAPAKLVRAGDASRVYDTDFLAAYEQSLFPSGAFDEKLEAYRNPPFFALLFVPTANLSYAKSAFTWTAISFACLALSVRLLRPARYWRALAGFVLFAPTFCAVSYGQTPLLTLLAFAGCYRLLEAGRLTGAGLAASLLLVKPPLLVGLVVWWLLDWRRYWPSLVGVICGGALLSSASMAATPEMWPGFVTSLGGNAQFDRFDWCKAHSLRAFWRLLLTPEAAPLPGILWLASAALAAGVFARLEVRRRGDVPGLFALSTLLMLLVSPHVMVYEWAVAAVVPLLLWRAEPRLGRQWLRLAALGWAALYASTEVSHAQEWLWRKLAGREEAPLIQLSIPAVAYIFWRAAGLLRARPLTAAPARPTIG